MTATEIIDRLSSTLLSDDRILSLREKELLTHVLQHAKAYAGTRDNAVTETIARAVGEVIAQRAYGILGNQVAERLAPPQHEAAIPSDDILFELGQSPHPPKGSPHPPKKSKPKPSRSSPHPPKATSSFSVPGAGAYDIPQPAEQMQTSFQPSGSPHPPKGSPPSPGPGMSRVTAGGYGLGGVRSGDASEALLQPSGSPHPPKGPPSPPPPGHRTLSGGLGNRSRVTAGSYGVSGDALDALLQPSGSPHPPKGPPSPPPPGYRTLAGGLQNESRAVAVAEAPEVLPAQCIVLEEFLAPAEVADLMAYTLEHEADFEVSEVLAPGVTGGSIDFEHRRSKVLMDLGKHHAVLVERIESCLPRVVRQLGHEPFQIAQVEAQITASNDGDFFRWHTDSGPGEIATREITFVYFFHREPKPFQGGELRIYDSRWEGGGYHPMDTYRTLVPQQNQAVFFLSGLAHEITAVECPSGTFRDSRFTVNGWFHR